MDGTSAPQRRGRVRVRSAVLTMRRSCPIFLNKQTISLLVAKSQRGHQGTRAQRQLAATKRTRRNRLGSKDIGNDGPVAGAPAAHIPRSLNPRKALTRLCVY